MFMKRFVTLSPAKLVSDSVARAESCFNFIAKHSKRVFMFFLFVCVISSQRNTHRRWAIINTRNPGFFKNTFVVLQTINRRVEFNRYNQIPS